MGCFPLGTISYRDNYDHFNNHAAKHGHQTFKDLREAAIISVDDSPFEKKNEEEITNEPFVDVMQKTAISFSIMDD